MRSWLRNRIDELLHWRIKINFMSYHYLYIIGMSIVGSILMYPVRNGKYIDMLFLSCGMSSQGGLATLNINDLTLYQQIISVVVTSLCTPIFIHSFVVFLRLYWYERHFNNIQENSKLQSKMRRTATMARMNPETGRDGGGADGQVVELGLLDKRPEQFSKNPSQASDDVSGEGLPHSSSSSHEDPQPPHRDIRFGDLPHPSRQPRIPVDPQDMFRSINMMQHNRTRSIDSNDDGPALVIRGPQALDQENERREQLSRPGNALSDEPAVAFDRRAIRHYDSDADGEVDPLSPAQSGSQSQPDDPAALRRIKTVGESNIGRDDEGIRIDRRAFSMEDAIADGENSGSAHRSKLSQLKEHLPRSTTLDHMLSSARDRFRDRSDSYEPRPFNRTMSANYLSWEPTVGRNSLFVNLTPDQKEELGGIEYRALKLLAKILIVYYIGFHILGPVMIIPWAVRTTKYAEYARESGVSPTWWAIYTAASSFNDLGFSLTPDSLQSYQHAAYTLLVCAFLIVIGNTGFPCMLRFLIWVMFKLTPRYGRTRESLGFLLDHPRRCFTLLFPSSATWWLFAVLVILNGLDLVLFCVLDIHNPAVTSIPVGYRIICGLFQAFATRTAGLQVVDISKLHAGVQVSYMVMMYISVLPIAISIRRTNVYEEQALGVYYQKEEVEDSKHPSYVTNHLRRQLSYDLWYVFLGLFVICIAETGRIDNPDQPAFSIFAVLFEVVSAYGTVGLSLGYPGTSPSFSAQFGVIGKLVICAMLIRGRHRGLPYSLDRAVMMPSAAFDRQDTIQESRAKRVQSFEGEVMNADYARGPSISSGFNRLRRMSMSSVRSHGRPHNSTTSGADYTRKLERPDSPDNNQWLTQRHVPTN